MREYIVADEIHPQPSDPNSDHHIHAMLGAMEKWDTRNPRYFDLRGENNRVLHPYIQSMGTTEEDRQAKSTAGPKSPTTAARPRRI